MNSDPFAKLLERGDCAGTFMFRYQNGEYVPESNLRNDSRPFTKDALENRLIVHVGLKPNPAVEGTLRDKAAQRPSP